MTQILRARGLAKRHGDGCPQCIALTGPEMETNQCPSCGAIVALHDVSLDLFEGEILGVMGESGSGKSTLVQTLCFDQAPSSGHAVFFDSGEKHELFAMNAAERRRLRDRRFGVVYQNPHMGLNFRVSAGGNIAERLLVSDMSHYAMIRERARGLLERMDVPRARMDDSPESFSGGMQQRVQIAKALATRPPLLFLDEVTTGLDLSVQARILDLVLELRQELRSAMIVVTHDLGVIRLLADRTVVMKYGRVVEAGLTDQILEDPQHAYTQRLVASML